MFKPPKPEPVVILGPAGSLEALVEDSRTHDPPRGFAVVCHPHPLFGGTMTNKVVHMLARALQEAGLPTVRFNFRGVGASAGTHDDGRGEVDDAAAVAAWGAGRWPEVPLWLAGFSFGAFVALVASARLAPARLITVAPPVSRFDPTDVPTPRCPWLLVQGTADEVVPTDTVLAWAHRQTPAPQLAILEGASHFFHGRLNDLREHVLAFARA
jgi:hypothetical protein